MPRPRCPECGGPITLADLLEQAREFVRHTPEGEHPNAIDFVDAYALTVNRRRYSKPAGQPHRVGRKQKPRKKAA